MAAAVRALPSEPWSTSTSITTSISATISASISASAGAGRGSGSSLGGGMDAWAAQGSAPDGAPNGSSTGPAHASAGPLGVHGAGHPPHLPAPQESPMPCSPPSPSSLSEGDAAAAEPAPAEGCGPEAEVQPSSKAAASALGFCLGPQAMGKAPRALGRKAVSLRSRDLEAVATPGAPESMPRSPSFARALSGAGPGDSLQEGGQAPTPVSITPRRIKKSAGTRLRDLEVGTPGAHGPSLHRASSLVASLLGVDADAEEGASLTPRELPAKAGASSRRLSKKSVSLRTRELEAEPVLPFRSPKAGGVSLCPASPGQGNPASKGRATGLKDSPPDGISRRLTRRLSKTGLHLSGKELEAEPLCIRSPGMGPGRSMQRSPSLAAALTKLDLEPEEFAAKPMSPGNGKTPKKVSRNSLGAKSRDAEAMPFTHPPAMKPLGRSSSLAVTFQLDAETPAPRRKPAVLTSGLGDPSTQAPKPRSPASKRFEKEMSLEVPGVLLGKALVLSPLGAAAGNSSPATTSLEPAALLPLLLPPGPQALEECAPGSDVAHELLRVYRGRYEQAEARANALETKLREKAAATKLVFEEAKSMRRALERELVEARQDLKVYKLKHERMEFSVKFLEGKLKTHDKMAAEALEQALQQNAGLEAELVEMRRTKEVEKSKEKEGPAVGQLLHAMREEHASMREYQRSLEDEILSLKSQLEGVVKANEGKKAQAI